MKQNKFILWCLHVLITTPLFSQIVNEGTFQIISSTTVYFGDVYTNKATGTHNNNGDLYLNNNFVNNGTTTAISGTTFFKSSVNDVLNISGVTDSIFFYNLEIDIIGATKKGVSVTDNFGIIVNNAVSLKSGDLRLVGDAQLVQTHTGANSNTSVLGKLLKDQQGNSSAFSYNYFSSPINNSGTYLISDILFDGTDSSVNSFTPQSILFNSGSPYNGLPSIVDGSGYVTTPLTINTNWLYKYTRGSNGEYANWIKIDQNTALSPGEGYTMKGTNTLAANQNYTFKGVPNDGEYLFPISAGESSLLGNPYPSAIDSHKFINDNLAVFDGTLHFWCDGGSTSHNLSDYLGGYATVNLTAGVAPSLASSLVAGLGNSNGVTAPTQYMAVGQGFFIEATGTGNIIFKNSQRVFKTESSGDSYQYKIDDSKKAQQNNNIAANSFIRIGYEDPDSFHRQLVLGFLPDSPANLSYNPGYDALMPNPREDELFYIIDNDLTKKYVIQGVGTYINTYEFPLGLIITQAGTHTIMLDALEGFSDTVYIKDTVLNTTYNLSLSDFNPNLPPGEYLDRFKIVFKEATLNVSTLNRKAINVYYNGNNSIVINNKSKIPLNHISIYNVLGQKIIEVEQTEIKQTEITIPFSYQEGLFFVLIESNQGKETYKIIN